MIAAFLSFFTAAAPAWLGVAGRFLRDYAKWIMLAIAATLLGLAIVHSVRTHTRLAVAETTIERQAGELKSQRGTIAHLRTIADTRIASAETFGRVAASLDASLAATLQRIDDAPLTQNCLGAPAIGAALDGVRAQRAAAARARVRPDDPGGNAGRREDAEP